MRWALFTLVLLGCWPPDQDGRPLDMAPTPDLRPVCDGGSWYRDGDGAIWCGVRDFAGVDFRDS